MNTQPRDAWQQALLQGSIIQGRHLKFAKAKFYIDDVEVAIGPNGLKVAVLMPSALTGAVLWTDGVIVDQRLHRYEEAPPPDVPDRWSPYTAFVCVGLDEGHRGELATYTSSAWSSRYAFRQWLIGPYVQRGRRLLPIVTFATKSRKHDINGNIDPIFVLSGWAQPSDFASYLPEEDEKPRRARADGRFAVAQPCAAA
jgi:hypothetical protein